ncbi:MAG: hypothetical protein WAU58_15805 [Terriglobales bacterium]
MRKEILVVGFACLSVIAVAQSSGTKGQSSNAGKSANSRNAASAQASGKAAPAGKSTNRESSSPSVSEVVMTKPAGKSADRESSSPSVSEVAVTKPAGNKTTVAAGDVNGDGHADVAASGHPTGKRQHNPVVVTKQTDAASPKN